MDDNKYIRFDWAAKRMLRDKANFGVFEGLITVLLNEPVHIVEILESESNQNDVDDKYNRVDIKARNSKDEIILVEIQQARELYYLERVLYGVAKTITEHISLGDKYDKVKKVYSISILYFDLGQGADYLYHGQTSLVGVHTKDTLKINTRDKGIIKIKTPGRKSFRNTLLFVLTSSTKSQRLLLRNGSIISRVVISRKTLPPLAYRKPARSFNTSRWIKQSAKPTTATLTISWCRMMCLILPRWKDVRKDVRKVAQKDSKMARKLLLGI